MLVEKRARHLDERLSWKHRYEEPSSYEYEEEEDPEQAHFISAVPSSESHLNPYQLRITWAERDWPWPDWLLHRQLLSPQSKFDLQQVFHDPPKHSRRNDLMSQLEKMAEAGDKSAFLETLEEIEWSDRSSTDFVHAIRLALKVGAHKVARQLSAEGANLYPGSSELSKYDRVLAPPKVVSKNARPDPSRKANREWLKKYGSGYGGQWVAIRNGELLDTAKSLKELVEQVGGTEGMLLTRVY